MTVLTFPSSPTQGQQYDAPNGIQYVFDGVKWVVETVTNTSEAISNSVQDRVAPMFVNGESNGITFEYDSETNTFTSTITNATGYVLPTATGSVLGGVKVGSRLSITNGVLSADVQNATSLVNGSYDVTLDVNGNTTFPSQPYIRQNNSYTRTVNGDLISGVPTVIWSGTNDGITSVKMTIQVEGNETGDTTGWHTQTCEAVIAERYFGNVGTVDPTMSVYGVVHTSVAPLVTFTVQRNATTHVIEVVATPTGTSTGTLYPKVHSVELGTRD